METTQRNERRAELMALEIADLRARRKNLTTEWFVSNRLNGRISPESIAIRQQLQELNDILTSKSGERSVA